jgi:hypothetical protein
VDIAGTSLYLTRPEEGRMKKDPPNGAVEEGRTEVFVSKGQD